MRYIEAPQEFRASEGNKEGKVALFIGGGITNCPDWQQEMVKKLADLPVTLLNPRRANFPIDDPLADFEQIKWEHDHLCKATAIIFWFPSETLCPIVLYELGAWSMTDKKIFVGTHPKYKRKQDVVIQTSLVRPEIEVVSSLDELAEQVRGWVRSLY